MTEIVVVVTPLLVDAFGTGPVGATSIDGGGRRSRPEAVESIRRMNANLGSTRYPGMWSAWPVATSAHDSRA